MPKAKQANFSQNFDKLSKIVESLESGDVDLNDALKQYEQGLKIASDLKKQLGEMENKVRVIKEKYDE